MAKETTSILINFSIKVYSIKTPSLGKGFSRIRTVTSTLEISSMDNMKAEADTRIKIRPILTKENGIMDKDTAKANSKQKTLSMLANS